MTHEFIFRIEDVEIPFTSFSILAGRNTLEAVIAVPPLPSFSLLMPGSYMSLCYKDPVLDREVLLADGVLVGVNVSKSADSYQVDLRFVSPTSFFFSHPFVFFSIMADVKETVFYHTMSEFLRQKVATKEEKNEGEFVRYEKPVLSLEFEAVEKLLQGGTYGSFVKGILDKIVNSSTYLTELDQQYRITKRFGVLLENMSIETRYAAEALLKFFREKIQGNSFMTVQEILDYVLGVVRMLTYGQGFVSGSGVQYLVVPNRFFTMPPSTNVFYPSMLTSFQLQLDYTVPTRVLEVLNVGLETPIYVIYPRQARNGGVTDEEMARGMYPVMENKDYVTVLAAGLEEDKENAEAVGEYFARKLMFDHYRQKFTGSLKTPFYPYIIVGLPAFVLTPTGHYVGIVEGVRHEFTVTGNAATFVDLSAVTPVEATEQLDEDLWIAPEELQYQKLFGVSLASDERSFQKATSKLYERFENATVSWSSRTVNAGKAHPEETLFWWAYERNTEGLQTVSSMSCQNPLSPVARKVVDVIKDTLLKHPVFSQTMVEELQSALECEIKDHLKKYWYPTTRWW